MAESTRKVHKVHRHTRISPFEISYNDHIMVEDTPTGKKMAFVRSKPTKKIKTSSQPVRRRAFLVSISFQSYSGKFSGTFSRTPMMRLHRNQYGPWPLLENDVHIFRYWVLCLVNDDGDSRPSRDQLFDADFFDFPQEPLLRDPCSGFKLPRSTVETIEAIQELGRTSCSNNDVQSQRDQLNGLWGTYYYVLWNSQQFAVRLSYLILQQNSLPAARTMLQRLLVRLYYSTGHFLAAKHFGCMAAFLGCGIATFGIGVFAAWSTAGGSMISHSIKEDTIRARIAVFEETFPELADI